MTCSCCDWGSEEGPLCEICTHAHKVTALFHSVLETHGAWHDEVRAKVKGFIEEMTLEQWLELAENLAPKPLTP